MSREALAVVALACIAGFIHFLAFVYARPPGVDEAWAANRAWALLQTGRAYGSLDAGVFDKFEGHWTYFPWLATAIHAVFVWLFGPTLEAVRLAGFAFGVLLLVAVFAIGRSLYGPRTAYLAVFLTAISAPFVASSHSGRHDIMVAALGFCAIGLHISGRSSGFLLRNLLAGLAVGLSLDVHPNALIYGPVILALHLHDHRWRPLDVLRSRQFWAFAVGAATGVIQYLVAHVLQYPETFFAIGRMGPAVSRVPPILTPNPLVWLVSLVGALYVLLATSWTGALAAPVLLLGSLRRSVADRRLLVLLIALVLAVAAVIRVKQNYYHVLLAPAAALAGAAFLTYGIGDLRDLRRRAPARFLIRIGVPALPVVLAVAALVPSADSRMSDYAMTVEHIRRAVPANKTAMGSQTYWLGLPPDQRYLSWEQLYYHQAAIPGSTVEDAFRSLRPDFFILEPHIEQFVLPAEPEAGRTTRHLLYIPKEELETFLATRARLVASVATETYGHVRIYETDWHVEPPSAGEKASGQRP